MIIFLNLKDVQSIIDYNKKNYDDIDEINIYDIIDDFNNNKYWKEGIYHLPIMIIMFIHII